MGLLGWIKKEIESTSRHNRRQSAPPPLNSNLNIQDPAYRRAIEKFREYRNSGRFERLNETKNASAITQSDVAGNKTVDEIYSITDVEIESYERERLGKNNQVQSARKHDNKSAAIYSNCNPEEVGRNKRLSLPIMRDKGDSTSLNNDRSVRKTNKIQPTNTIDEIEEFEQNHCRNDLSLFSGPTTTPPSKFFRNNSDPYGKQNGSAKKSSAEVGQKQTPKRLMGKNMLRRKGKAPQPPRHENKNQQSAQKKTDDASESTVNFYNGNFRRYEVSTNSVDDEFVISSKAYKGHLRRERLEQINSVGESSSCSLSSDEKNVAQERRQSLLNYQTVINKHGEEVEYALPYNERDSMLDIPPLPNAPIPQNSNNGQHQVSVQFEQLIDQNFKFLNSKMDFLNSQINVEDEFQKIIEPMDSVDFRRRQNHLQVTDLDKSNEAGLASFPAQTGDILKDLDALAKWTQNFEKNDQQASPIEQYQAAQKGVKVFNACDIKYKPGSLRNSFSTPLEFSNGYFHRTPITLRSTLPNNYSINNFADMGCKHEFEILCQIKHMNVVTLMGICFDRDLRVTSLIMEPFDYTLNHYLHQMDKFYNIQQTVSIIHQIASATQYLNECGFIHSNISSHAVLIRENPFAAKLSSFELATEILHRDMSGKFYEIENINANGEILTNDNDHLTSEKYGKLSKQHFYNRTSLPVSRLDEEDEDDGDDYKLPFSIPYRRMYSMHYYQAPELLVPTSNTSVKYVKPTVRCDVYGLGLLLWELINRVVPYVIYNHDELINGLIKGNIQLPLLDKSSIIFREIFEHSLHVDRNQRISSVSILIKMLEDLQLLGYEKDRIEVLEIIEPRSEWLNEMKAEKNIKNSDQREKLREKIYFSKTENDPQKRFENALTTESLANLAARDTSKISESVQSAEMEPHLVSFNQQPGILLQQDDALDRIRKTVESQRDITPKKPSRKRDEEHLEVSKNSTMFQSFFGFSQTPKIDKDVIYERTSTLKKRMKASASAGQKKSVKGLFDNNNQDRFDVKGNDFERIDVRLHDNDSDEKKMLQEQLDRMNIELNNMVNSYNKSDFMQEIVNTMQDRERAKKDNDLLVSSFLSKALVQDNNMSRSFEELPMNEKDDEFLGIKGSEKSPIGSNLNRFSSHESFSLPHTPIARQNMIRRNAWLSENNTKPSGVHVSDEIAKRSLNFNKYSPASEPKPSPNLKQYNVNIKIHHNDLDTHTTPKSTNLNQSQLLNSSSSVKIKLYNSSSKLSPIVKINNVDLNKTSYTEDINKKYYPLMPEMLSDAIQNKRDKSTANFSQLTQYEEERNKINNEKKWQNTPISLNDYQNEHQENYDDDEEEGEIEERVIVPVPISVRDTVKFIETTYKPKGDDLKELKSCGTKGHKTVCEETQTDEAEFLIPKEDPGKECLMKASESIQKLENLQQPIIDDLPKGNKKLEYIVNHSTISTQTPKKITTKLTLNLKKITGRSSDVSHLKRVQEQVKNNPELLKQLLKESSLVNCNNEISASCSNLIAKSPNDEVAPPSNGCRNKYFCRNCGFTMIPTEILQKIQNSGRLSIASSIADSLQSIKYDESLQSLAAIRKCQQSVETRSTEDLYIDDDFCQGITNSLAANMELLPPPDFFDTLDFNIFSAEIFHTQEEFDDTLTGMGDKLKEIEGKADTSQEEVKHVDAIEKEVNVSCKDEKDENVPICDDEIKQDTDEPKV